MAFQTIQNENHCRAIVLVVAVNTDHSKRFVGLAKTSREHTNGGRSIDLFCLRTPYGIGYNQSGGAYRPSEQILLYAFVAYDNYPIIGYSVGL